MHDIIIVGGGVAGSYLASKLSSRYDVALIERSRKIIPKDSGIVSRNFTDFFGNKSEKLIKCDIKNMECVSPSEIKFYLESDEPYAHILHRKRFAKFLRSGAKKRAEIIYGNAKNIKHHDDFVSVETAEGRHEAKMIIGCDGANSTVRKSMGIDDPKLALGIMVKTRTKLEGEISVYFNKYYSPDFFSWVIPQNKEYGLMTAVRPRDYFNYFSSSLYMPPGKTYAYSIPFTYTKSFSNRAILVGDACGQNKPLTGGGIMFSLTGAKHALSIVNDAFEQKRFDAGFLGYYESYWRRELAWEIEKQFIMRMVYRKLTNKEIDEMFSKFGPLFSTLKVFDYDRLGSSWGHFGKMRFAKFIISKLPRLL